MGGKPMLKELRAWGAEAARQAFELPLYEIGIRTYAAGVGIASLFNRKAALMTKGHRGVLRHLAESAGNYDRWIWVHAASLGEFEQARPIIERIRKYRPDTKILLTFFSPSGYEVRKNYEGADIICYLPFDTFSNAKRLVERVRPEMAIFVKYEFWRNYLTQLRKHGVPTYLISGVFRPEQKFFKKNGSWYKGWLRNFSRLFVQDERSRRLLESAGFDNVTVAGDTRFDRVTDIKEARKRIPEIERFKSGSGFTFIAGSSWPEDEDVYIPWLVSHPEVKGIIAPHEFDMNRLEKLKERFPGQAVLLSEARENPTLLDGKQVLVIDCFGLLSSAYAYADIAYVGGAFGAGLHNINEAAVYGIPVIFGPRYDKFIEAQELTDLGGGISIDGKESFIHRADRLLYDSEERKKRGKWAGDYITEKTGASDIICRSVRISPEESN